MDILGIGPLELLFILVIALIVLGPRDIARFARSAGRALNRIYRSEAWGAINKASREFRDLPNRLAREAALDDLDESIRTGGKTKPTGDADDEQDLNAWKPSPKTGDTADHEPASSEPDQSGDTPPPPSQGEASGSDSGTAQDEKP